MTATPGSDHPVPPCILLLGTPSARPEGLERALARAGLQLLDGCSDAATALPDLILVTADDGGPELGALLASAVERWGPAVPRMVLIASGGPAAVVEALRLGAVDALAAPVHLPELVARLEARCRTRRHGDVLTGCDWSHALDQRLVEELDRARRYALGFSLVLLDIDDMRDVNERFGLETGDRLLVELGALLRRELRSPDFVCRYGGDEFALVLPETGLDGARSSVARIRERLARHENGGLPADMRPRLSAGIATFPHPSVQETGDLLALGEMALMRGKSQSEARIGTAEAI